MDFVRTFRVPLLALAVAAVMAIPASASSLAWNVTTPDSWAGSNQGDFADVLTVNGSNITLSAIGIPVLPNDVNGGVYTSSVNVAIYDSVGNLLTGANLNPGFLTPSGGYYWANVVPVTLGSGLNYTVVVNNNGAIPAYGFSSTGPTSGWATFDSSEFLSDNVPFSTMDPGAGNTVPNNFYDINLLGTTASAVPEPESLFLLGSGLIGLAGFARFKLRKH